MARQVLTTSLQVPFSKQDALPPLRWEQARGSFGDGSILLGLFPSVSPDKTAASVGTLNRLPSYDGQLQKLEYIRFNNSDTTSTEFPPTTVIDLDVEFAFNEELDDITGDVNLSIEPVSLNVVSNIPFYGVAKIAYASTYRAYKYIPDLSQLHDRVFVQKYGSVYALYKTVIADREIDIPELEGQNLVEVYRDVSSTIATQDETYEKPPGWPDATHFTGKPIPSEPWFEAERVHEIGYGRSGSIWTRRFIITLEEPYRPELIGNSQFFPVITRKVNSIENMISSGVSSGDATSMYAQAIGTLPDRYILEA